jgi:hypothetical protein
MGISYVVDINIINEAQMKYVVVAPKEQVGRREGCRAGVTATNKPVQSG